MKTGARAAALASMLASVGYRATDAKVRAPRLHDLTDELKEAIRDQFQGFGGDRDAAEKLRPGSWDLVFEDGLLVELDEELHFNRYRAETLEATWTADLPWSGAYLEFCAAEENACLAAARWGKRWTNPSCERLFGAGDPPGTFESGGAPRWKQRALYDAIKDAFARSNSDFHLARVSVYDEVEGFSLEQLLRNPSGEHGEGVADLVTSRKC